MEIFKARAAAESIVDSLVVDIDKPALALAANEHEHVDFGGTANDVTDIQVVLEFTHAIVPNDDADAVESATTTASTIVNANHVGQTIIKPRDGLLRSATTDTPALDIYAQSPTTTLDRPITILIGLLRSVSSLLAILPFINSIMKLHAMMLTVGNALMDGVSTKNSIALPDDDMPSCLESLSTTEVNINDEATTPTLRADSSPSLYQICIETLLITILVPLIVILAFILLMALVSRPDPISSAIQVLVIYHLALYAARSCSVVVARLSPRMMNTLRASLQC